MNKCWLHIAAYTMYIKTRVLGGAMNKKLSSLLPATLFYALYLLYSLLLHIAAGTIYVKTRML
jgi:uncharacterized membrane protein